MKLPAQWRRMTQIVSLVVLATRFCFASANAAHFTTLYHFKNSTDGETPLGGLVQDSSGVLYGTTSQGGNPQCHFNCHADGTVFSYSSTAGLKTLTYFKGPNGGGPESTLLLVKNTLIGTAGGGAYNDGVIFSLHTDGTGFHLLHQFNGADGNEPVGTPQLGAGGILYGITFFGGADNYGVLFSIAKDGNYTILHTFTGSTDGGYPNSLLISPDGVLFGATGQGGDVSGCESPTGCGVIFSYTPSTGQFAVAYSIQPGSTAGPVLGSIGPGPTVYGTTIGIELNQIFALGPTGFNVEPIDYLYTGTQVPGPELAPDRSLVLAIGQTNYGGAGILLNIKNDVVKHSFGFQGNYRTGGTPGEPLVTSTGIIYGTTRYNGACGECGTIYEITP